MLTPMKKMSNYRYSNPPADNCEEWKDIDGYEGIYKISDKGRIWSVPRLNRGRLRGGNILKVYADKRNRINVHLNKDGKIQSFVLARLVAKAFIRKPVTGEEINHKDENPLNNSVDNLEWCDHKYNCNYGTRIKRIADAQSLPIMQTTLDGKFVARHKSMQHIERSLGFNAGHICDVCNGKRGFAYGYKWRFEDDDLYRKSKENYKKHREQALQARKDAFARHALDVLQYDLDGNLIAEHQSSRLAAESTGISRRSILNNCQGVIKTTHGFIFKYKHPDRKYGQKMFIDTEQEESQLSIF